MAGLSGGEILSGALGAGINETLIKEIGKIKDPAMQQIVSAIIGGVAGELAGGDAQTGAGTAASGTKNNHFARLEINDHLSNAVLMVLGYEVIVLEDGQKKIVDEFGKVVALCDSVGDWLLENSDSVMNEVGTSKEDFIKWAKESSKSQKERAKDIPSWAKGEKPNEGESGKDFAERLCNEKFGKGNYKKGPRSDFNKLKKYGDRNF